MFDDIFSSIADFVTGNADITELSPSDSQIVRDDHEDRWDFPGKSENSRILPDPNHDQDRW